MNLKLFKKRLVSLYSSWRKYKKDLWAESEILVICTPPSSYHQPTSISTQFFTWLMGLQLDDTIVIFTFTTIYVICDKNKVNLLNSLTSHAQEFVHAKVVIRPKGKSDDGCALLDKLIYNTMVASSARSSHNRAFLIGSVSGECPSSQILGRCGMSMKAGKYRNVSINDGIMSLSEAKYAIRKEDVMVDKVIQMQYLPEGIERILSNEPELESTVEEEEQVCDQVERNETVVDSMEKEEFMLVNEGEEKDDQATLHCMENSQESLEYSLVAEKYDHDWVLVD